MFKKILSFALIVSLLNIVGVSSAYAADSEEEKEARFTENVKAGIAKLGTGKDARIEVKLKDRKKLKGYISEAGEENFVIVDEKTKISTTVAYPHVKQLKGKNLSTLIVLGVVVAVVTIFFLVLNSQKERT